MISVVAAWTALAERLGTTGIEIFRTAEVAITPKGFSDEKVLALTLLARSVSNLKGVLVLLRAQRIVVRSRAAVWRTPIGLWLCLNEARNSCGRCFTMK
jgi:hypothetical protein